MDTSFNSIHASVRDLQLSHNYNLRARGNSTTTCVRVGTPHPTPNFSETPICSILNRQTSGINIFLRIPIQSNVPFLHNKAKTVRLLGVQMCSKPPNEYCSGGAANSGCFFVPATKAAIFAFTNIEIHSRASKDSEQPLFHLIWCLPARIVCSSQRLVYSK